MKFTSLLVLIGTAVGLVKASYPNPMACTGSCTGAVHDPFIIRRSSDGTYFRFATGGTIPIYTAPALTGPWTSAGNVLNTAANVNSPGNTDLWVSRFLLSHAGPLCQADITSKGPRCPPHWLDILSLLRGFFIRNPELRHRPSNFHHPRRRILDRPWRHPHQCNRRCLQRH